MIFLDANVVLRFFTAPATPEDQDSFRKVERLFGDIANEIAAATLSELVIHEVGYVLTSKRHYGLAAADAADMLRVLITMPGIRLPAADRKILLRALELWAETPAMEFADNLYLAKCELNDWELATFDRGFQRRPVRLHAFGAPDQSTSNPH